jgi:hypothetical protein
VFDEATIENDEAELAVEVGASQRSALKQKDSNAQPLTNIPTRQQKRGVSFAAGSINNDRQPIQLVSEPYTPNSPNMFIGL